VVFTAPMAADQLGHANVSMAQDNFGDQVTQSR
jgi:hypothetical protein